MPELAPPTRRRRFGRWLLRALAAIGGSTWAVAAASTWNPPLQICASCNSEFACPTDWEAEDSEHWWIRMRCGECGHVRDVVVDNQEAAELDRHLAWQTSKIEQALDRLDRQRMAAQIEQFVTALECDLVDATDFA